MPAPRFAGAGNTFDFLSQHHLLDDRVRRLELADDPTQKGQVESFIMDPITVRPFPPALAYNLTLTGVLAYFGSGGPVTVTFKFLVASGTPTVFHTFSGMTATNVYYALAPNVGYGDQVSLDIGDLYWPEISSGSGSNIACGFITVPG